MSKYRPEPGTPDYEEWLAARAKMHAKELFHSSANFEERGKIAGGKKSIIENDKPKIVKSPANQKSED